MARVGFLGTGEIAAPMVRGIAGAGHDIRVSERNADVAARLAAEVSGVSIVSNAEVVGESDVVFLCLMADTARSVVPGLPWRADQSVISVMVDCPRDDLLRLCHPATDIALTIPLPFIARGNCPLPVFPDSPALSALYGAANPILPVATEAGLNAHFVATALCSPILAQLQAGARWLGSQTGDEAGAEGYVAALFAGYLGDLAGSASGSFDDALAALSTEGGLNATLRDHMAAAPKQLPKGMNALAPRLGLFPVARPGR